MTGSVEGSNTLSQKIVRGSLIIFVGNLLGVGSLFLTRLLAARHLTPGPFGTLVLGITVLNVLTFISILGLSQGLGRELPRSSAATELTSAILYVPVGIAAFIAVIGFLSADLLAALFDEPQLEAVFRIFIVVLPIFVFTRIMFGVFQGFEDTIGKVLSQNFFYQALVLSLVGCGVLLGLDVVGISIAWASAIAVSGVVSGVLLFRRIEGMTYRTLITTPPTQKPDEVRSLLAFSIPLMVSGLTYQLLIQTDNLLVGYFLTNDAVGLYDASFTLGMGLQLLIGAFSFLTLPILSDLHSRQQFDLMDRMYKLIAKWMLFLAFPLYALILAQPVELLTLVFGESYGTEGGLVLIVVASGFFLKLSLGLNSPALKAVGHPRLVMVSDVTALVLNVALNVVLIPRIGILGAAIASFVAFATANGLRSSFLYRTTGIQPLYMVSVLPLILSGFLIVGINVTVGKITNNILILLFLFVAVHLVGIVIAGGIEREDAKLFEQLRSGI